MIWPPPDSYLGIREYPDNGDITDDDDDEDNNNDEEDLDNDEDDNNDDKDADKAIPN